MYRRILAIAILLFTTAVAAMAAGVDISGTWKGELALSDGTTIPLVYSFKQDGGKLSGTVKTQQGQQVDILDGTVEGNKVTFRVKVDMNGEITLLNEGKIDGDQITLTTSQEDSTDDRSNVMTLKRAK